MTESGTIQQLLITNSDCIFFKEHTHNIVFKNTENRVGLFLEIESDRLLDNYF